MADIGDVAVALLVDGRLIGAARLQVVVADEAHVLGFGRIADLRRLRRGSRAMHRQHDRQSDERRARKTRLMGRIMASLPIAPSSDWPAVLAWSCVRLHSDPKARPATT